MKKLLLNLILSVIACQVIADNYNLSTQEQTQIFNEAEDWIDDMPEGYQDRKWDAIMHSIKNFPRELQVYRPVLTPAKSEKTVKVSDIKGGKYSDIILRLYQPITQPVNKTLPLLIFLHGGGWTMESIESSDAFCKEIAASGNSIVVSVEYPLAPENPYPAALKYLEEAFTYIKSQAEKWGSSPALISLGGEDAGGNLAWELYQKLGPNEKVRSLVLYYPLIEEKNTPADGSKIKYQKGYGLDSRLMDAYKEAYAKDTNLIENNRYNSLPPVLIIAAGRDVIYDDIKSFSKKLKDGKTSVTFVDFTGAIHGFVSDGHQKTAFKKAASLTASFLKN